MKTTLTITLTALSMLAGAAMSAFAQTASAPVTAVSVKDDPWCSPRAQFSKLQSEHEKLFGRLDTDGDEIVSRAEFVAVCTPYDGHSESRKNMAARVVKHFSSFDRDGDGMMTLGEYSESIMM